MAETWDEARLIADGFEHVHAELDWYDGPCAGLADIDGTPHYFRSDDPGSDQYEVWPAAPDAVAMERELWGIFVRWNQRAETGAAGSASHPGRGGVDARYDELTALLAPHQRTPEDAGHRTAEARFDGGERDRADGTDHWFRWSGTEHNPRP